jgi:hypothetical protein
MADIDLSVVLSGGSSIQAYESEAFLKGDSSITAVSEVNWAGRTNLSGNSSITARPQAHWAGRSNLSASSSFSAHASVKYVARARFDGSSAISANPTVNLGIQSPIRYQPSSRTVNVSKLVLDQVDLFRVDGKTRAQNVAVGDLNLKLFFNGSQVEWPLVDGAGVQDLQVTAGQVYWTEFLTGFYTIRFFPNVVGSWRILLTYPAFDQAVSLAYDVELPSFVPVSSGIRASFIKRM